MILPNRCARTMRVPGQPAVRQGNKGGTRLTFVLVIALLTTTNVTVICGELHWESPIGTQFYQIDATLNPSLLLLYISLKDRANSEPNHILPLTRRCYSSVFLNNPKSDFITSWLGSDRRSRCSRLHECIRCKLCSVRCLIVILDIRCYWIFISLL